MAVPNGTGGRAVYEAVGRLVQEAVREQLAPAVEKAVKRALAERDKAARGVAGSPGGTKAKPAPPARQAKKAARPRPKKNEPAEGVSA